MEAQTLTISSPKPRQITQRQGENRAHLNVVGLWLGNAARLEARAVVMAGTTNNGVSTGWAILVINPTNGVYSGVISNVVAGGWYRIEVRAVDAENNVLLAAGVDRVGVGDIFLTAGQSNAACFGSPQ